MADIERDPHAAPVLTAPGRPMWAGVEKGRVENFNATRPGRLGAGPWDQYEAIRAMVFEMLDEHADEDGTVKLQDVVDATHQRDGKDELFRKDISPIAFVIRRPI